MPSDRRLHPATLLFSTARSLREAVIPLAVAVLATAGGARDWVLAGMAVVLALVAVGALLAYLRFTYRFDADELVVRSGVLFRKERQIPYARVQNVDAVQNLAHRLTGTAVVHVQTGSGTEPEASLRVLGLDAVEEMRRRVGAPHGQRKGDAGAAPGADFGPVAGPRPAEAATPAETLLLHLDSGELLLRGFVENRGMVLIFGALALLERADVFERLAARGTVPGLAGITEAIGPWHPGQAPTLRTAVVAIGLLLVVLLAVRLLSVAWAVVRLHDYRLTRAGGDLRVRYGLLTRVSATIPLRRIQVVVVEEGLLHRLFRRVQVSVVTAGGGTGEQGRSQREVLAPILPRERLDELVEVLMPGLRLPELAWEPAHPRAFGRMARRGALPALGLTVGAWLLLREWAAVVLVLAGAHVVFHARMRARHLGWTLTDRFLAARGGSLWRSVRATPVARVQATGLHQNPFDRRAGMAHVRADTAGVGGGLGMRYLPASSAAGLQEELRRRVVGTPFTW